MSSLVPRFPTSFPSLEIRTANDGGAWGTRLTVISDSAYELSYICALAAGSTDFRSSKERLCSSKQKWLKSLTQRFLSMKFAR